MQQVEVAQGSSGWDSEWWGPLLVNPFPYKARYLPKKDRHVSKERRKAVYKSKAISIILVVGGEESCRALVLLSAKLGDLSTIMSLDNCTNQGTGLHLPDLKTR